MIGGEKVRATGNKMEGERRKKRMQRRHRRKNGTRVHIRQPTTSRNSGAGSNGIGSTGNEREGGHTPAGGGGGRGGAITSSGGGGGGGNGNIYIQQNCHYLLEL